jgi:hypothetical protein
VYFYIQQNLCHSNSESQSPKYRYGFTSRHTGTAKQAAEVSFVGCHSRTLHDVHMRHGILWLVIYPSLEKQCKQDSWAGFVVIQLFHQEGDKCTGEYFLSVYIRIIPCRINFSV